MHQDSIIVSVEQAVAIVTINSVPQRNALSNGVVGALTSALDRLEVDPSIKVPMLTGQGMHFAAGTEEMHSLTTADVVATLHPCPDARKHRDVHSRRLDRICPRRTGRL